jgi:hypothetical protein
MSTVANVQAWLSDIAEKMSGVVDPVFRASLTGQYLTLLEQWHRIPENQKALLTGTYADAVEELDRQVSAGMLQYKLEPGLGDLQDDVRQALEQALASMGRLKELLARQADLPTRRRWEDRLNAIAGQLQRVDDELAYAPHSLAHFSRLNQMANTVNNLVAVEMLPLELEWSGVLRVRPPKFQQSELARSGALNMRVNERIWRQGLGDQAMDVLTSYNQAVTDAWLTKSADVQKQAEIPWGIFKASLARLRDLQKRLTGQAEWLTVKGGGQPGKAGAWKATLNERITAFNSLAAEARGLADQMKQLTYNRFDEPEQVVQKMLGGDLPRSSAAVALLFDPQIRMLAQEVDAAWKTADSFDADAGIRTR